jgi:hypothetical protein
MAGAEADVSGYYKTYSVNLQDLGLGTLDVKSLTIPMPQAPVSTFDLCLSMPLLAATI